jgi:ureidoacrylate peracid hydrolase
VSDCTASGNKRHYETTLERVRDYYGLVLDTERFYKLINSLEDLKLGKMDSHELDRRYERFLNEFRLIDVRKK